MVVGGGRSELVPLQAGGTCPLYQVAGKPRVKPREKLVCTREGGQTKGSRKQRQRRRGKKRNVGL